MTSGGRPGSGQRLGVVTTSYPRWPGDLAGAFVAGHAHDLAARGHVVTVLAAGAPNVRDPDKPVRVIRVPDTHRVFFRGGAPDALDARPVSQSIGGVRWGAALAAAVRREGRAWEGVACHWLPTAAIAAAMTRGPMLAVGHSGDVHVLDRAGLLGATLTALLARGARLVFVAPGLHARARAAVPRPLRGRLDDASLVHPMGIDVARFAALAARRAGRARGEPARLLFLGRLVPVKGVDVLLAALDHLRAPVELTIAGDGPARAALEARAAAVARHRVRFVGAVDPDRRDALLADADALVVPSIVLSTARTEGTPTVVLEAVAAAVPVVASAAGGLAELPDPWARRVPPGDPRALADALTDLLADAAAQARASRTATSAAILDWRVVGRRLHAHWFGHSRSA